MKKQLILWKGIVIGKGTALRLRLVAQQLHVPPSSPHLKIVEAPKEETESDESAQQSLLVRFRDVDGGIFGVRFFDVMPGQDRVFLVSPTSRFVWEKTSAIARDFKNEGAVRGHVGFHAAWPASLERWTETFVDHGRTEAKALVKGYGDLVIGEAGWRSERMTIMSVQSLYAQKIALAYDEVSVIYSDPIVRPNSPFQWLVTDPVAFVHPRMAQKNVRFIV